MADGLEGQTLIVESAGALPGAGAVGELVLASGGVGVFRHANTSRAVRIIAGGSESFDGQRLKVVVTAVGPATDGLVHSELAIFDHDWDNGGEGSND
ncbi:hypothetical protein [Frankia tisae]|uniref:hypothetical protein n=1 Tax=Frankia tisae TaxID=2950104 RepID=UPI0021BFA8AE|nr:hypothetical protein [Frankia tisae]